MLESALMRTSIYTRIYIYIYTHTRDRNIGTLNPVNHTAIIIFNKTIIRDIVAHDSNDVCSGNIYNIVLVTSSAASSATTTPWIQIILGRDMNGLWLAYC